MSGGALAGIRVIDLTHAYNGPFCTMHLADHGAEVIKIERPGIGDQTREWPPFRNGESGYYAFLNRNKRGITLDIRKDKGKEILFKLLESADVLVENFRPGTMAKLGLDYEHLKDKFPRLIYACSSGFGSWGPLSQRPCYDIVAQAMGGIVSITGFPEGPPTKVGPSVADNVTGTYLALGITMALLERERTGKGQYVEVAMMDTIYSILENAIVVYTMTGKVPERQGNADPAVAPFDMFRCQDGYIFLGVGTNALWERLCSVMNRPELLEDPRFLTNNDRVNNYAELKPIMEEWTATMTMKEIEDLLVGAGIPVAPILNVAEVTEHPHTEAREMIVEIEHPVIGKMRIQGVPIKLSRTAGSVRAPAPLLGQHTEEVLTELGYTRYEIEAFRQDGVI